MFVSKSTKHMFFFYFKHNTLIGDTNHNISANLSARGPSTSRNSTRPEFDHIEKRPCVNRTLPRRGKRSKKNISLKKSRKLFSRKNTKSIQKTRGRCVLSILRFLENFGKFSSKKLFFSKNHLCFFFSRRAKNVKFRF